MQALILWLVLIPAPKAPPPPVNPLIGAWSISWGTIEQTTFFRADGTCYSPEFGNGLWSQDADGYVWFSERDNTAHYVMRFDLDTGTGTGWSIAADGQIKRGREIRLQRCECLPLPRLADR